MISSRISLSIIAFAICFDRIRLNVGFDASIIRVGDAATRFCEKRIGLMFETDVSIMYTLAEIVI